VSFDFSTLDSVSAVWQGGKRAQERNGRNRCQATPTVRTAALAACWLAASLLAAPPAGADSPDTPALWQHHEIKFTYIGLSTSYSCDGLQQNIRALLLHFGARKDLKVSASGCPSLTDISRRAFVDADFYALAPAAHGADSSTLAATWSEFEVSPRHPSFMDSGDCELVEQLKDSLLNTFSLRDVDYRTDCFPYEVNLHSFQIKGWVLKLVSGAKAGP
jgi:hypothetical protein